MSDDLLSLDDLQVFFGATSPAETRVYALLPQATADVKLRGRVEGPHSLYARTLTAPAPLIDRGRTPDGGRLAEAFVADPCFWSPESPFLYDVRVEVLHGDRVLGEVRRTMGIRPLGVRGGSFVYGGARWVLRAIERTSIRDTPLAAWREAGAAMVVDDPAGALLAEADRVGVLVVARTHSQIAERLASWSRHASVGIAILDVQTSLAFEPHELARNVVLSSPRSEAGWADVLLGPAETTINASVPFVARRPLAEPTNLAAARVACDALQRDLAGRIDAAGYIV